MEELCRNTDGNIDYEIISGHKPNSSSILLIDEKKAEIPIAKGGLRWRFTKNRWLGKAFLWQSKVWRLPFQYHRGPMIFMGVSYYISTLLAMIIAKFTRTRVLLWTHGYRSAKGGLRNFYRTFFYRLADGFLLFGNRGREIMIMHGFRPESLYVVYNSLPYRKQLEARSKVDIRQAIINARKLFDNPAPVLIWSGRLVKGKKIEFLIKALGEMNKYGKPANLILIGDGPLRPRLEKMVAEHNIENLCRFHGACYDEEQLAQLFMGSDLCVSTGPIGLLAIHAMGYGLPVLTNDDFNSQGPEAEAIVEGETGAFFKDGDLGDFIAKIKQCLDSLCRDRQTARQKCQLVIDNYYSPARMTREINRAVLGLPPSTDKPADLFRKRGNRSSHSLA